MVMEGLKIESPNFFKTSFLKSYGTVPSRLQYGIAHEAGLGNEMLKAHLYSLLLEISVSLQDDPSQCVVAPFHQPSITNMAISD